MKGKGELIKEKDWDQGGIRKKGIWNGSEGWL